MVEQSKFNEVLGPIPLLVGVYTKRGNLFRTPGEMVDEVMELDRIGHERGKPGVSGVYLENNGRSVEEIAVIEKALVCLCDYKPRIKVGVSIFPNLKGTEFVNAFNLAKDHNLSFIAQDIVTGHYTIDGVPVHPIETERFLKMKSESDAVVIGGILPPYAEAPHARIESGLVAVAAPRVDALMVKKRPGEKDVPRGRVTDYKVWSGKPVILASGISLDNISEYIRWIDGGIVGSGARLEERLCGPYIKGIANIVANERERRDELVRQL